MNKEALIQMTYEIQQTVANLMNGLRNDCENDIANGHYHSAIMQELTNKVRFIESECME